MIIYIDQQHKSRATSNRVNTVLQNNDEVDKNVITELKTKILIPAYVIAYM